MTNNKSLYQLFGRRDGLHCNPASGASGQWSEERVHQIAEARTLPVHSGPSISSELESAREVQRRLLPPDAPVTPGHWCRGFCRPAGAIGGDYYDFLPLPSGNLAVVAGDVSGKGIGAALMMANLRAAVRALTLRPPADLGDLMEDINRLVFESSAEEMHASLFYGQYDPLTKLLRYVNAGHHPPLLLRSSESGCEAVSHLDGGGIVLGVSPDSRYEQAFWVAEPGDLLVAYTDGVIEALNPADEEWGKEAFEALLGRCCHQTPESIINTVLRALGTFTDGAPQHDDITLAVVRLGRDCAA